MSELGIALADDDTIKLPLIVEYEFTTNPVLGATDAVTEPLAINVESNASGDKAERGISNNPLPLPLKNEPVATLTFPPVTKREPVN